MSEIIKYNYLHQQTEATTGYFSCQPSPLPSAEELIVLMAARPLDSFLRRHALFFFAGMSADKFSAACKMPNGLDAAARAALAAFLLELALAAPPLSAVIEGLQKELGAKAGPEDTPLLYLRRAALPDSALHAAWAELFSANIQGHRKLPAPGELAAQGLPPLFTPEILQKFAQPPALTLPALAAQAEKCLEPEALMAAEEVAGLALERLKSTGVIAGEEQRHTASLSPVGLLMPWQLDIAVHDGRNAYTLAGQANTYGRGLSLAQARASCRMEMLERFSAYLSIKDGQVLKRAAFAPLRRARLSQLLEAGEAAVDPNNFYLEAPYLDYELVWIKGQEAQRASPTAAPEYRPLWVPLQMAALFSNCDELDLASSPGSTGIATGSTPEMARLAALTEILERDAEATTLYSKKRCFQLDISSIPAGPQGDALAALLQDYRALGINVQFMDMTGPLGLPCYQAFVIGPKGSMHRGHGASISGPRALVSAITETPYPYPDGGISGPMLRNLPARSFVDLPDYSSGSLGGDLALLEALLCQNGLNPVYVDFTHESLKFPVTRALVPGLQPAADFDDFTRLSPRLYKDYLSLYQG